jgi:hypothetical protein
MAAGKSISKARAVRSQLGDILLHMRQIQSAVVVTVAALRQQDCELDADIAAVLQRSVGDRMHEQIEKLEATLRLVSGLDRKG